MPVLVLLRDPVERFLSAIADRLEPETIAEAHLFPPIRQGGMETGIAIVAAEDARVRVFETRVNAGTYVARNRALEEIQQALGLDEVPLRIECYDVSNLQGTEVVASMVVFEDGLPRKSEYRRFVIRGVDGQNDVASMHEVITRRFRRLLEDTGPDLSDTGARMAGGAAIMREVRAKIATLPTAEVVGVVTERDCADVDRFTQVVVMLDVVESVRLMERDESGFIQRWRHFVRDARDVLPDTLQHVAEFFTTERRVLECRGEGKPKAFRKVVCVLEFVDDRLAVLVVHGAHAAEHIGLPAGIEAGLVAAAGRRVAGLAALRAGRGAEDVTEAVDQNEDPARAEIAKIDLGRAVVRIGAFGRSTPTAGKTPCSRLSITRQFLAG